MAPSSSGSGWDGADADIIDLDRYMRGNVRPSRTLSQETQPFEQLVVDCGKPNVDITTTTRYKHYSHDSGVSDSSYRQRRPRKPHRPCAPSSRPSNPNSPPPTYREPPAATPRTPKRSSESLRQFKTVCEQVLVDQQKQIARVVEVCERLERAENERTTEGLSSAQSDHQKPNNERSDSRSEKCMRVDIQPNVKPIHAKRGKSSADKKMEVIASRLSSETSDLSSSTSHSSASDIKDLKKPDKQRASYAQECKTYKIIMRKLDELNRRFGPQPRAPPRRPPSSSSVSVCDKLVATDPERTVDTIIHPTPRETITLLKARDPITKTRPSRSRAVQEFNVGVAHRDMMRMPNVVKERTPPKNNFSVKCESSSGRIAVEEDYPSPSPYDLDDPLRLYAQAKQLQAMAATTRRAHSVDVDSRCPEQRVDADRCSRTYPNTCSRSHCERPRSPSLCAVCRAYLRSLRQCLIAPLTDFKVANT